MRAPTNYRKDGLSIKSVDHGKWYTLAKVGNKLFTDEANHGTAEFIVQACNAHDDLVAALQAIADGQVMQGEFTHADTVLAYQRIASAALSKVNKSTP